MQPAPTAEPGKGAAYVPAMPVTYAGPYTQLQGSRPQSSGVTNSMSYLSPPRPPGPDDLNRAHTMPPRVQTEVKKAQGDSETGSEDSEESEDPAPPEVQEDTLQRQSTSYRMNKATAERTKASFKRPQWYMLLFGNTLCLMAGIVDVGSLQAFEVTTTHVTGNTAKLAMWLENENVEHMGGQKAYELGLCVIFFCFGSFLCGLIIPKTQIHFGGKGLYGTALIAECILLLCAKFWPQHQFAPCWAAMAAGLQNAMCTMHFGAIVRTTHVTGTLTDIGSTTGRAVMLCLRRFFHREGSGTQLLDEAELHVDKMKLIVLVPLYCSFFLGCVLGAILYRKLEEDVFLIPAAVTGTLGLVYSTLRETLKIRFKSMEKNQLMLDMSEIQQLIDRTQTTVRRFQYRQSTRTNKDVQDVDDLDDQLRHMADLMHDVQGTLGEMYAEEDRGNKLRYRMNTWG